MSLLINPYRYAAAGAAYAAAVLADSPLAYYRLGEPSGTTMADSSGNARHGVYSGTHTLGTTGLVVGDPDTCDDFTNSSQNCQVADAPWMDTSFLTIEALINVDAGVGYLIARSNLGGGAADMFRLGFLATSKIGLQVFNTAGTLFQIIGSTTLSNGTTYHVAGTFDGSTAKVYVNGVQDGSVAASGTMRTGTQNLFIGALNSGVEPNGRIDEVAIYDYALTAGQLLAHKTAAGI